MGVLDLPAPLFNAADAAMQLALPAWLRLIVWALIAAPITVGLYWLLSPQGKIGQAKRDAREARSRLNRFDGEIADAGPLIKNQFVTAFRHLGLVIPGTLIAALPFLCLLVWTDNHYSYELPPANAPPLDVKVVPDHLVGRWQTYLSPPRVKVFGYGHEIAHFKMTAPVATITKYSNWNRFVGNPLGYLPANGPIQQVTIDLPEREYLPFGPGWLRHWLALFMPVMFLASFIIYKRAGIQ